MKVFVWIFAAALLAVAATSFVIVDETEHVVVTQFGRPTAVYSDAGFRLKAPAPVQRVSRIDKRRLFTETRATELLTADKKNVIVSGYVSWRVSDPLAYLRAVRTREFAENRLAALIQSELGSGVGGLAFASLVSRDAERSGLAPLERTVRESSEKTAAESYGIEILDFGITRLGFPPQNLQSVFARMRAERSRIARGFRSEGEAEARKIRARADRERDQVLATARSDAERVRGEGEAEAARIYADAYRGHETLFRFLRTLESYERALKDNTTLVLPADSPFLELLTSRLPGVGPGEPGWPERGLGR
jgi:membrane protease subunit HflC